MTEAQSWTAASIAEEVGHGRLKVNDVARYYIERTERYAEALNSHIFWSSEHVLTQVAALEARLAKGEKPVLAGVPVVVKDNINVKGLPTTCASKILKDFHPPYDAHVITRLKEAGAIFFGKANCDEFAMGSSNENSAFGPVRNPWSKDRVPGGSSGGSAAAVAASLAPVSLGSDTGGSIRQPAAFCGVIGLKPTYGRLSRYGLVAYGSSLDQIGPFTRTVKDAALLLDVMSGHDERDSTSAAYPPTQTFAELSKDPREAAGLRIGVVREFFAEGLEDETRQALEKAIDTYKKLGATIHEVSLPNLKHSIAAYYVIATAEASANLARYDGVRYGYRHLEPSQSLKQMYRETRSQGFGREVKQRIMLGTFVLSSGYYDAFYSKANRVRKLISDDFQRAFANVDLLISPTSPTSAFKIGEKSQDPLAMYLSDICTIAINLAGIPAASIPCGFDSAGLPIGLQLMAPAFSEERLLKGAYIYEQASRWHERQPELW